MRRCGIPKADLWLYKESLIASILHTDWSVLMFFDVKFPIGGDVLFYRSNKPHGKAITAKQSLLGFDQPDLMHAAIMVDNRVLVQATTAKGVHYVPLYETSKQYYKNVAPTVLRHRNLASSRSVSGNLWQSSFYFYKQKYDWVGALQKHRADQNRKICSTLVQMILSRLKEFPEVSSAHDDFQIYPAELFGALMDLGFEEVGPYDEPRENQFGRTDDLAMIKAMDQNREIEKMTANAEHWAFIGIPIGEIELFRLQAASINEQLLRIISQSIPFQGSLLLRMQDQLEAIANNIATYERRSNTHPINWRDKRAASENELKLRKSVEYEIDLASRQMGVVADFLDAGINEYLEQFLPDDFKDGRAFASVFRIRLLDASSELTETPSKLRRLVETAKDLDIAIKSAGLRQNENKLLQEVLRLFDIIAASNKICLEILGSEPELIGKLLLGADDLCSKLWAVVEKELSRDRESPRRQTGKSN